MFSRTKLEVAATVMLVLSLLLLAACGPALLPDGIASTDAPLPLGGTTSSTLLFPLQLSFMQELSGGGYQTAVVFTDQEGGAEMTIVRILVDPGSASRATNDAIFAQALALAKKYGAADSTGGRLRIELSDAPSGAFIKDYTIESRDFDLDSSRAAISSPSSFRTVS